MSSPYVGEIRMFGGNFAPAGWAFCDGQLLPISENETLFQLIGTTYGGDGQETFALPNLQGRASMGVGNGMMLAESGGVESVTLTTQQIPIHNHVMLCSAAQATVNNIQNNFAASMIAAGTNSAYGTVKPYRAINPGAIGPVGGSQPHDNQQPFLVISFILSLFGIFPPPN
jgi:microcystin-dependent protein